MPLASGAAVRGSELFLFSAFRYAAGIALLATGVFSSPLKLACDAGHAARDGTMPSTLKPPGAFHNLVAGRPARNGSQCRDFLFGRSHRKRKVDDVSHFIETEDAGCLHYGRRHL